MEIIKQNFKKFLYILMFLPALLTNKTIDNDFYFLYSHGKIIIEKGFIKTEPLTMHENLHFIMQQWLSSVIFYLTYENFKKTGLTLLIIFIAILTIFFLFKILFVISDNEILSIILTFPVSLIMLIFTTTRPAIFTLLLIVILLYSVTMYIRTNKKRYLILLPIISLLQINLHAAMWIFLFIFLLPFFAELKCFNIYNFYTEKYNKVPLILATLLMIPVSLINPYGIEAPLYIFNSLSNYDLGIMEMQTPTLFNPSGEVLIVILLLLFIIVFNTNNKINIRYFFLFFGCIVLVFFALKTLPYLMISFVLLLANLLKNIDAEIILSKVFGLYDIYIPVLTVFGTIATIYSLKDIPIHVEPVFAKGINYLCENYETNSKTVFTSFNNGAYAEYKGLKCYIDPRMEVFLEKNNHKKDYVEEYYNLRNGTIQLNDFTKLYNFDYMIIDSSEPFYNNYSKLDDYFEIYTDEYCKILKKY